MVLPAVATIAAFVAAATPAAFKVIDATCTLLEQSGSDNPAINALRGACEVRKAITKRRKRA